MATQTGGKTGKGGRASIAALSSFEEASELLKRRGKHGKVKLRNPFPKGRFHQHKTGGLKEYGR